MLLVCALALSVLSGCATSATSQRTQADGSAIDRTPRVAESSNEGTVFNNILDIVLGITR